MDYKNNFFYINSDYGYNKKDFTLLETFENKKKNNEKQQHDMNNKKYKITKQVNRENNIVKNNTIQNKVNTFPLAWTCYKNNSGGWTCPMRGDK